MRASSQPTVGTDGGSLQPRTEVRGGLLASVQRVIGPGDQGAVEPDYFKPFTRHPARILTADDYGALEVLLGECAPADVEDSGVSLGSFPLHGCFTDSKFVSVAKGIDISLYAMTPGILTHPAFRGKG